VPAEAPAATTRILVVDDEEVVRDVLSRLLGRHEEYEVEAADSAEQGLAVLERAPADLVLLDIMLPGVDGLTALKQIKNRDPDCEVIMMTAHGSVDTAVEAMKFGAYHYLTKPFQNDEVLLQVQNALTRRRLRVENEELRRAILERHRFERIVGKSPAMQAVYTLVEQVAPSRSTVLIQGESGTGKELVAQALHRQSPRAEAAFVPVNSNSIPPDLLESNLFGHMRGAFTGAVAQKKGLFEVGDGGTLFFDEISTVHLDVQAKLLRVIQEREFLPLGSTRTIKVDVRIVAATNQDLRGLVEKGLFREDLFYRLHVITIDLPPLRRRREDIPLLVEHFLDKYSAENGKKVDRIAEDALQVLVDHPWPGNVRQLENAIERAVVLAPGREVSLDLLPPDLFEPRPGNLEEVSLPPGMTLPEALERYERQIIETELGRCDGVQRRAAERLGVRATTLSEKIRRLGLRS
jgi:DNA-binding NtrC family response regulator